MAVVTDDMHGPNRRRYAHNYSMHPHVVVADGGMLSARNILVIAGVVALVVLVMRR